MKRIKITILFAVVLLVSNAVFASPVYFSGGHSDIGMSGEEGLELHLHVHEGGFIDGVVDESEYEFAADEVVIVVPENAFDGSIWALPQSKSVAVDMPFLGIGSGEAELGTYVNDVISFSLLRVVSSPEGGDFVLWQNDSFDNMMTFMTTADGVSFEDNVLVNVGSHSHSSWGFTAAGIYELEFQASSELVSGGVESDIATFTFEVVPEPASALLLLAGLGKLARRRK